MWMQQPIADASLTLITPFAWATYSGMLPGTLAGLYTPADMEIDLYRLIKSAGVELIVDEAIAVDTERREVQFHERPSLTYDVASIGVGSVPRQMETLIKHPGFVPIKPMFTALQRLDSAIQKSSVRPVRVAVIGGGAAGVEVALCAEHRIRVCGCQPELTLIDANPHILAGFRNRTVRLAEKELRQRNINIRCGARVTGHDGLDLIFDDDHSLTADVVVWATGACPQSLLRGINLPKSKTGFLRVRNTLQSVGDESIFVVGDSAEIDNEHIDRAGVYAVRQGPILWQNLTRRLEGRQLVAFKPQRDFLRLMATGDGRAIAQWKWFAGIGGHWWKLKNHIDLKFMNMHRPSTSISLPPRMTAMRASAPVADADSDPSPMRCRGCGGKTSARVLHRVLHRLRAEWPTSPPGFLQSDDTAVLPAASADQAGTSAVSVDFFPAFLTDAWLSGRIAAIHALSDLWASGVQPTSALAMVTLPDGSVDRQSELLHQVLSGAVSEFSIGFTVFGRTKNATVDQLPLSKANLRPGQLLILTKALGAGVILAANEVGRADARSMAAAIEMMLQSNQRASELAAEYGVTAATDVTGFGLAGHLLEMCQQSGVSAELLIDSIPLLKGAAELINAGIQSSLFDENKVAVQDFIVGLDGQDNPAQPPETSPASDESPPARSTSTFTKLNAILDPQTSGGLLLGVDADHANLILAKLVAAGHNDACIVGQATDVAGNESRIGHPIIKIATSTSFRPP